MIGAAWTDATPICDATLKSHKTICCLDFVKKIDNLKVIGW